MAKVSMHRIALFALAVVCILPGCSYDETKNPGPSSQSEFVTLGAPTTSSSPTPTFSTSSASSSATGPVTLSGQATKGAFNAGDLVRVYEVANGSRGRLLATTTTRAGGGFTIGLGPQTFSGNVLLETTGTFTNEIAGPVEQIGPRPIRAAVFGLRSRDVLTNIQITPLTEFAVSMAVGSGVLSSGNYGVGLIRVAQSFLVVHPESTPPVPPAAVPAAGQTGESVRYGFVLAGFSKLSATKGVRPGSLVAAMSEDAADGALDGRAFASAVLLTDRSGGLVSYTADTPTREFQAAVRQFMADTVPVGPNNPPTLTGISVGTTRATTNLPVLLSGTGISDPNGDTLSYLWTATLNGRNVEVFGRFAPSAILLPPLAVGTYDVRLTVWDPGGLTAPIAGASVPVFPAP